MRFSSNDFVRVKLTERGRARLRQAHDDLYSGLSSPPDYNPPKEDDEGWSRWQFWEPPGLVRRAAPVGSGQRAGDRPLYRGLESVRQRH